MGVVRQMVRDRLEGFEVRQAERNAARHLASMIRMIHHYRRSGVMNTLEDAEKVLTRLGISWDEDRYYGVTLLSTRVGVVLCYGPDGRFAWGTGPSVESSLTGDQLDMFSDDPTETSSA